MNRLLFIVFFCIFMSDSVHSEEVNVATDYPDNTDVLEVPVDVDTDYDNIKIKFKKEWTGKVIVSDSEKVVYNDKISAPRHATLNINISGCEGGDYDIMLIDNAGNVSTSSFSLTETYY